VQFGPAAHRQTLFIEIWIRRLIRIVVLARSHCYTLRSALSQPSSVEGTRRALDNSARRLKKIV